MTNTRDNKQSEVFGVDRNDVLADEARLQKICSTLGFTGDDHKGFVFSAVVLFLRLCGSILLEVRDDEAGFKTTHVCDMVSALNEFETLLSVLSRTTHTGARLFLSYIGEASATTHARFVQNSVEVTNDELESIIGACGKSTKVQ